MKILAYNNKSKENGIVWQKNFNRETDSVAWSDRLYQQDDKKYDDACKKVWGNTGQMFYNRGPEEIEQFLFLYLGKKVILTAIAIETNWSNGYPYWIFHFKYESEGK